ncbi:UNVERIFIED_CONTAM: hypothetical protein GTU68_036927 [Idotea baltica]|nr:hypothetical protein [Idotea baltica]
MARVCDYCGKGTAVGGIIARRGLRTKRTFKPNIQRVRAVVDGKVTRVKVCTRCMKSGKIKKPA